MEKDRDIKNMGKCFLGTLLLYIATYGVASRRGTELVYDYVLHTEWTLSLNLSTWKDFIFQKVSYPLWHIITKALYRFWGLHDYEAAATCTALFNCFAYWCVNYVWIAYEKKKNYKSDTWFWSFFLFFMGPIYAPLYTFSYYMGQGIGNTWKNPTNIAVKGISVLAFALICYLISEKGKHAQTKVYIILGILLLLSALAKPSFLQAMIPGTGMYLCLKMCHMCCVWGGKNGMIAPNNMLKSACPFCQR